MYSRIVRDYPLSIHAEDAKAQLKAMNRPVPDADPVQEARMKFELQNRTKPGLVSRIWSPFGGHPDTYAAAKSGTPQMESFHPETPLDVPVAASGRPTTNEVTIGPVANRDILDKAPDARAAVAGTATSTAPASGDTAAAPAADAPKDAAPTTPATAAPAASLNGKKLKTAKAVAPKKRARPAATTKKGAAPAASPASAPAGTTAQPPAQGPAQAPQQ
jgi:hypothetical protein